MTSKLLTVALLVSSTIAFAEPMVLTIGADGFTVTTNEVSPGHNNLTFSGIDGAGRRLSSDAMTIRCNGSGQSSTIVIHPSTEYTCVTEYQRTPSDAFTKIANANNTPLRCVDAAVRTMQNLIGTVAPPRMSCVGSLGLPAASQQ